MAEPLAHFALLTPRGPGGVAVVAVAGAGRHAAVAAMLGPGAAAPRLGVPSVEWLWLDGEPIDQMLLVERETTIELHMHGSEAVLAALERHVGPLRLPPASAAERLLQTAMSEAQVALALEQRAIDFEAYVRGLRELQPRARFAAVGGALARTCVARALAEPVKLVLCGAQNAGKSTLMNRLLFAERVLVGEQPGLTRDPVCEATCLDGYPYLLIDTAGEGPVEDALDREAIDRGRRQRSAAWKLVVVDGARGPGRLERELGDARTLWVQNKADLPLQPWPEDLGPVVRVSCLDPTTAPVVRAAIGAALTALRELPGAGAVGGPAALDARQEAQLRSLVDDSSTAVHDTE